MDDRERVVQAKAALDIGRFKETVSLLAGHLADVDSAFKVQGYCYLAYAYLGLEKYKKSLKVLETAVAESPNVGQFHTLRGLALEGLNLFEDAEEAMRTSIRMDPRDAMAYKCLSDVLLQQKKADEALAVSEEALAISPDDADCYVSKAKALYLQDRNREAGEVLDRALAIDPESDEAMYCKGLLAKGERRVGFFRRALRGDKENEVYQKDLWIETRGLALKLAILIVLTLGMLAAKLCLSPEVFGAVMNGGYLFAVFCAGAFLAPGKVYEFFYFAPNLYLILDEKLPINLSDIGTEDGVLSWIAFIAVVLLATWFARISGVYLKAVFFGVVEFFRQVKNHFHNGTLRDRIQAIFATAGFWIGSVGAGFGTLFPIGLYAKSSLLIGLSFMCLALVGVRYRFRAFFALLINGAIYYLIVAFVFGAGAEFEMPALSLGLSVPVSLGMYYFLSTFYALEARST